tara:strand:- start:411 stop:563 length:153 start_codon:yes stop_codon:yes gene_type:complete
MPSAQIKITSAIRKTETLTGLQIKIKNSLGKQLLGAAFLLPDCHQSSILR